MKKILVVDLSLTVRLEVARALAGHFEVIGACNGVDSLVALFFNPDTCLVLCELSRPGIAGLAVLEALRRDAVYAKLPVVMLTPAGQAELIVLAKRAGAKGAVVTPFRPESLLSVVSRPTLEIAVEVEGRSAAAATSPGPP